MSNHVGPIIFADETARSQLVEHGEVVTFRQTKRTTGDTWWRTSRTGEKEGDVTVEEIKAVDPFHDGDELREYRELSGFETVLDWQKAIQSLNGGLDSGYLYRATVKNDD